MLTVSRLLQALCVAPGMLLAKNSEEDEMNDISIWKLCVDIGLVLSLLYMCYRFGRGTGLAAKMGRITQLESSLKGLLRSAEQSSEALNEELKKRQRTLEQLLFDIESTESRINRALDSAEEARRSLQREQEQASRIPRQSVTSRSEEIYVDEQPPSARAQLQVEKEVVYQEGPRVRAGVSAYQQGGMRTESAPTPEPPSFASQPANQSQASRPQPAPRRESATRGNPKPSKPPVNIYGEPLTSYVEEEATPQRSAEPLTRHVEKEVEPMKPSRTVEQSLEDVYASAEELLRAGQGLEQVAAQMRLPVEEVRMLSQIISQEQKVTRDEAIEDEAEVQNVSSTDERLGVLAGIRRERQVL